MHLRRLGGFDRLSWFRSFGAFTRRASGAGHRWRLGWSGEVLAGDYRGLGVHGGVNGRAGPAVATGPSSPGWAASCDSFDAGCVSGS